MIKTRSKKENEMILRHRLGLLLGEVVNAHAFEPCMLESPESWEDLMAVIDHLLGSVKEGIEGLGPG